MKVIVEFNLPWDMTLDELLEQIDRVDLDYTYDVTEKDSKQESTDVEPGIV